MKCIRLYTGPDGKSHFGEWVLDFKPDGPIARQASLPPLRDAYLSGGQNPSVDRWHTAPQRQFVVPLRSPMEIEAGDGAKAVAEPGDILLAEDLTGQGHITRFLKPQGRLTLLAPLAEGKAASVSRGGQGTPSPIKVTRMYTGKDNRTHLEDMALQSTPSGPASISGRLEPVKGGFIRHRANKAGVTLHNAPQRQYLFPLKGGMEIELGDGTKRRFTLGDVVLAEDLTGEGHITRVVGDEDRYTLFLVLA